MVGPRRKRARKYVSLREKLAAALSMLLPQEVRDDLRARKVPAKVVIGMFDQDHVIFHAIGGPDKWWNFTPMLRGPHREKSRRDKSTISKMDRVSAAHDDFRRRALAIEKKPRERSRWPQGRRLQSRPFPKRQPTRDGATT